MLKSTDIFGTQLSSGNDIVKNEFKLKIGDDLYFGRLKYYKDDTVLWNSYISMDFMGAAYLLNKYVVWNRFQEGSNGGLPNQSLISIDGNNFSVNDMVISGDAKVQTEWIIGCRDILIAIANNTSSTVIYTSSDGFNFKSSSSRLGSSGSAIKEVSSNIEDFPAYIFHSFPRPNITPSSVGDSYTYFKGVNKGFRADSSTDFSFTRKTIPDSNIGPTKDIIVSSFLDRYGMSVGLLYTWSCILDEGVVESFNLYQSIITQAGVEPSMGDYTLVGSVTGYSTKGFDRVIKFKDKFIASRDYSTDGLSWSQVSIHYPGIHLYQDSDGLNNLCNINDEVCYGILSDSVMMYDGVPTTYLVYSTDGVNWYVLRKLQEGVYESNRDSIYQDRLVTDGKSSLLYVYNYYSDIGTTNYIMLMKDWYLKNKEVFITNNESNKAYITKDLATFDTISFADNTESIVDMYYDVDEHKYYIATDTHIYSSTTSYKQVTDTGAVIPTSRKIVDFYKIGNYWYFTMKSATGVSDIYDYYQVYGDLNSSSNFVAMSSSFSSSNINLKTRSNLNSYLSFIGNPSISFHIYSVPLFGSSVDNASDFLNSTLFEKMSQAFNYYMYEYSYSKPAFYDDIEWTPNRYGVWAIRAISDGTYHYCIFCMFNYGTPPGYESQSYCAYFYLTDNPNVVGTSTFDTSTQAGEDVSADSQNGILDFKFDLEDVSGPDWNDFYLGPVRDVYGNKLEFRSSEIGDGTEIFDAGSSFIFDNKWICNLPDYSLDKVYYIDMNDIRIAKTMTSNIGEESSTGLPAYPVRVLDKILYYRPYRTNVGLLKTTINRSIEVSSFDLNGNLTDDRSILLEGIGVTDVKKIRVVDKTPPKPVPSNTWNSYSKNTWNDFSETTWDEL